MSIMNRAELNNTKKLAIILMREFTNTFKTQMGELNNIQLIKILEKYSQGHWMLSETYNSIIQGLSQNFNQFTPKELASACQSFATVGLR